MTDYIYENGTSGSMRHASGGLGARNGYPWIGHPRERRSALPHQPRFALSGPAWSEDQATFQAHVAANNFDRAMTFIVEGGFTIQPADIPEPHRAQFVAWVRGNANVAARDCLAGAGWS